MESQPRFLRVTDVAEVLNVSPTQAMALVRRGDLPAIRVGGRGQWRVERVELEAYIQRGYAETLEYLASGAAAEDAEVASASADDDPTDEGS